MSSPIPDPIAPRNRFGHTVFSLTSRTRNWNSRCVAAFRAEFTACSGVFPTARTYAIRESEDSKLPTTLPGRTNSLTSVTPFGLASLVKTGDIHELAGGRRG